MAERVCEPMAASIEPGEIARRASAICASNTSRTGRGKSAVVCDATTMGLGLGFSSGGTGAMTIAGATMATWFYWFFRMFLLPPKPDHDANHGHQHEHGQQIADPVAAAG